ncbi:multicopper oxidase family protein [Parasedimentitalea marina]|uniref:Multicopper oxidase family protein n=1 Tax=Parasedimentitalea marina TaxID=2483033 RepID=A0A3T0N266_9RHOB|nr:multicopper oxidase family protein [Parasedimentitalea marina]AZV78105.1 multicopper oxidase family protein [Parasedimentitalea marina]
MNRRDFLAAGTAALLAPRLGWASSSQDLVAQPVTAQILPDDSPASAMWGYNGNTPGPELRLAQGGFVDVRFLNQINQGSAVHWHGLRSENAMDGVPGLTQDIVPSGGEFAYRLRAPDAGTFWYHAHNRSWEQVAKGMYGPLIVEERNPPDVDHDMTVLIDDWRMSETGVLAADFDSRHDQSHAGRLGNFARAIITPEAQLRTGDRVRFRLLNVATDRIFPVELTGIQGKVVALDGMPLTTPQDIADLVLTPAQRVDIIADVTAPEIVQFLFPTPDSPYVMGEITVSGANDQRIASPITPLPANEIAQPDLDAALLLTLTMEGGAMSPRSTSFSDIWGFNGQSGLTDKPFHDFERGQTARISLVNDTRFPHGIHLHGHHFFELNADGEPGAFRDTTLIEAGETRDILCVFDNPGKWLLHCHMLGHQAAGMKTWVNVS